MCTIGNVWLAFLLRIWTFIANGSALTSSPSESSLAAVSGSSQGNCHRIKPCVLKIKDSPSGKLTPWDSTPTMVKGHKAQTTFPDCGFLSYSLYIMQYLRHKQFTSCRVVRWLQEGSMQYMRSTAWTKQRMDPERKSSESLKIGCPCPFCPCPAE
jgi:hypothetical protein